MTAGPASRLTTGIHGLDPLLGGGLMPGALAVVVGATGCGKTQLGLQFARSGMHREGRSGLIVDLTARGDSQYHREYARRLFDDDLLPADPHRPFSPTEFLAAEYVPGDLLHVFERQGRHVSQQDMEWEEWQAWQAEINRRLRAAIAFLYGNLRQGARRVVVDGVEPAAVPRESIQLHLFEFLYHQVLRKDPGWVARDLFRESFRTHALELERLHYDPATVGCLLLLTSHDMMLDDLIGRPLDDGDLLANANTVIYLGKIREGRQLLRGLYVAKHRGSACSDRVVTYTIGDRGLSIA